MCAGGDSEKKTESKELKKIRRGRRNQNALKNFKVLFNNIRGAKSKLLSLENIIHEEEPVLMGVAETHLNEGENFTIKGYKIKRSDRKADGGGVMVVYNEKIQNMVTVISETSDNEGFDSIWIKLNNGRIAVQIGVVYMPQENESTIKELNQIYQHIENEVSTAVTNKESVILMGDFNCRIGINESTNNGEISKGGKILLKMAKKYELCVANKEEMCSGTWTRILGDEKSAIDFVLVRDDDKKLLQSMNID